MRKEGPNETPKSISKEAFSKIFKELVVKKGVSEKARPYYELWLREWGQVLRKAEGRSREEVFREWILELGRNERFEDFQIHQAIRAMRWAHTGRFWRSLG